MSNIKIQILDNSLYGDKKKLHETFAQIAKSIHGAEVKSSNYLEDFFNERKELINKPNILVINAGSSLGNMDYVESNLGKGVGIIITSFNPGQVNNYIKDKDIKGVVVLEKPLIISKTDLDFTKKFLNAVMKAATEKDVQNKIPETPSSTIVSHGSKTFRGYVQQAINYLKKYFGSGDNKGQSNQI